MNNKFKSTKFRYGFNATLITVLFIVAVLLINMLAGVITDKFPDINIDLTKNKQFAITQQTKDALKDVNMPVTMKLMLYEETSDPVIEELLGRYKQIKSDIYIEKIDLAKNPTAAQKYGNIDPYGTLVIENGDKFEVISFDSLYGSSQDLADAESLITNGIISATVGEKKTVLFSEGHGEYPAYGIAAIAQKNYYNYDVIDLKKAELKPQECDLLVIFAPTEDFTQQEIAAVESYVLGGGQLQIYLNPLTSYLTNLCEYVKEWGIEVKNETVAEKNNNNIAQQGLYIPVVSDNDYTKNIDSDLYYQNSFRLDILYSETKGITAIPVLTTTTNASTVTSSGDTNRVGQYNISVVSERVLDDNSIVKMYVSGSTLIHEREDYLFNDDICSSVISGMLASESYVEIPSKSTETQAFRLTTTNFIFIIIIIVLITLAVLAYGIVVWSKRRFL